MATMNQLTRPRADHTEQVRVFCAIELPAELRALMATRSASLRASSHGSAARWESEEKLHLTLKFLGEINAVRLPSLALAAGRATAQVAPFELQLAGPGVFPLRGPARVLWIGLADPTGRLASLQQKLEEECRKQGFPPETKSFHPHVTIARLRAPAPPLVALHLNTAIERRSFTVRNLVIMRSELRPEGSRYTPLASFDLGGEP